MKKSLPSSPRATLKGGRVDDFGTIEELREQVQRGLEGLDQRLNALVASRYRREPACVYGEKTFKPSARSFDLDVAQTGAGTVPVNMVLESGQDYLIPITVGSGNNYRFYAHGVRFVIRQRALITDYVSEMDMFIPTLMTQDEAITSNARRQFTTKFSCYQYAPVIQPATATPAINFVWNLVDGVTKTAYSDGYIPGTANYRRSWVDLTAYQNPPRTDDGGWHRFSAPKLIGPQQPFFAVFRPLTDVVQLASTTSPQSVTVRVEMQGEALYEVRP